MRSYSDTIFALATNKSKSALATFRISEKKSIKYIKQLSNNKILKTRRATVCFLLDNEKNKIDQVVVTIFKSPFSYTGEDMVEVSCHGSVAVINKITDTFLNQKIRWAEPGEFTKRALMNNKINIVQAETINELVNAETDNQRKIAIGNLTGNLDRFVDRLSKKLSKLLADVEATIDFSDEELPKQLYKKIKEQKENIEKLIKKNLEKSILSKKIYEGFLITIIGKPNTGKSSFINYINNKEISIVTNIPGTTTDLVTSVLEINGNKYTFVDTAGIRRYKTLIEKIGIEKSIESAKKSDLTLVFLRNNEKNNYKNISNKIFIKSKFDINAKKTKDVVSISSINGYGIKKLLQKISNKYQQNQPNETTFSRERHIQQLKKCETYLKNINFNEIDKTADNIRRALTAIQDINQKFDIEEILDIIFNDFCIGK